MTPKNQFPRPIEKLVILGLGKSSQDWPGFLCDHPEAWDLEVWTVNAGARAFNHDVVFDMHTDEYIYSLPESELMKVLPRREWLKTHDKPIVVPKVVPELPTSVAYPLKLVVEQTRSNYFANGLSYMLALAYMCGVRQLFLFGTDFSYKADDKHLAIESGRACSEYWLGRLAEAGCMICVSAASPLMDTKERSKGIIYGHVSPLKLSFDPEGNPSVLEKKKELSLEGGVEIKATSKLTKKQAKQALADANK